MTLLAPLLVAALLSLAPSPSSAVTLQSIIDAYGLDSGSYNFTWPTETLDSSDATSWINEKWSTNGNKLDWGDNYIVFTADPSTTTSTLVRRAHESTESSSTQKSSTKSSTKTSSSSSAATSAVTYPNITDLSGEAPSLRIEYPSGSYSKKTGGTQFYAQPLNASSSDASDAVGNSSTNGEFERMLLTYDIWFPTGFSWVKGGKLPGLRGGSDPHGCSGGSEADGETCFSSRLMWRTSGSGEVYAYIPTSQKGFCSETDVTCNSDYGTSLSRGGYSFATGKWQTIYMLVILNEVGTANGQIELWYNGVPAVTHTDLIIRSSDSISSIGGLYFSTFFGGDDSDWASPTDQYVYFRNIQLYGGLGASNLTGSKAESGAAPSAGGSIWAWGMGVVLGMVGVWMGL
ncbi:hypothetical protein, variant 2 [Cryptococcus amylolentus CBS 6039]|uniref:Polysaccharide lyase 14 domain-containing protein n=2 Tax=Cryptococcus amylolentus TaxID=104669 RepID=A0A1E3I732_9TREE|nr:hypothetical protein L202_01737 [Cryptococcus amylolentus CBS 6039]XP_018997637.1 hypothetical protein, variant 1 [Cryptococcus amylolentus CBS 6039]XP_018997638.1 hypothetical protein, variant 2 [Cryptococcus amylolentus CBS 6039]ODO11116.1 hypothetical protein I350_01718 [Cryptococcus amylolentus CBS 6273]ODN83636.1 hypothetical protein L202_01737 [Cryptococcus amylolentus CBS 6039]ODN83637.1 hypothetical protein, variant 1 [Cryptococcus amylolentus CBS 6039]ODN83638.1 hypothetical prote